MAPTPFQPIPIVVIATVLGAIAYALAVYAIASSPPRQRLAAAPLTVAS